MAEEFEYRCDCCGEDYKTTLNEDYFDYNLCSSECVEKFFDLVKE